MALPLGYSIETCLECVYNIDDDILTPSMDIFLTGISEWKNNIWHPYSWIGFRTLNHIKGEESFQGLWLHVCKGWSSSMIFVSVISCHALGLKYLGYPIVWKYPEGFDFNDHTEAVRSRPLSIRITHWSAKLKNHPDTNVHGANMGPIWGRQDPVGPHVGPMNIAIWAFPLMISFSQIG